MDMRSWKKVLLQWITECGFMERNYFNIEQSDIDVFYQNYLLKHQRTDSKKYQRLGDFLKEFYPSFDLNLDDENCISSADYIYVYSLLLHYCCVKHPETLFHHICQKLPEYTQQCIAAFFKELLDTEPITKEALRHAIAEVANTQSPPPRLNDSFSLMGISGGGGGQQSATMFSRCESPLKTPKRSAGPHRVSPSTPKSNLLEERTREVYNLRAQLETERYEKGLLEVQIKQNEDKIYKLNYEHKKLLQQIQDLKNDIIVKSSDCSTNRDGEENQVQKRLLKELHQREQEIIKLSESSSTLREEKALVEEKIKYAEENIVMCMNRIKELNFKVNELKEDAEKKNDTIEYLSNRKLELEKFINDNRISSSDQLATDLNTSTDCLDNSYIRSCGGNNTNSSNSLSSPENLGASVIDIQLREKEHENHLLKEELLNVKREHKRLAKELTKLTQDFVKPDYALISDDDNERDEEEEDAYEKEECETEQISCEEQFFVFNNCMEKINKYHKTEKNKVKQLEEATQNLQEENEDLRNKLDELNEQVYELKEVTIIKTRDLEEMEKSKMEVQEALDKIQIDFKQLQGEKQTLYKNLQSSENLKESLNQLLKELTTKLEIQQKSNRELTTKNINLETTSQTQLQDLQHQLSTTTVELEEEILRLNKQLSEQIEKLKSYQQMETTLKNNHEQIMIQNNELMKQARETDGHLSSMRQELEMKDKQMSKLAEQINDVTQKNLKLEENINRMVEEYKQDSLINDNLKISQEELIQNLEKNVRKLKDDLCKTELLLESKQHELELVMPKIRDIHNIFGQSEINDVTLQNLVQVEAQIKSLLEETKVTSNKLNKLQAIHLEASYRIEQLELELREKSETIKQNSQAKEELMKLQKLNKEYEDTIENFKEEQVEFLAQVQRDVVKKELELQERLKEAASEYENSLDKVGHELKLEKEQNNNKEMELLVLKAEHNEIQKLLKEKEAIVEKLEERCEKLKDYEMKVSECSQENDKLRLEIETFKQEVTQNALRLLEADKALTEFMDLTKEQDSKKTEMENLQKSLQTKDETIAKMETQLEEQAKGIDEIEKLQKDMQEKLDSISVLQEMVDKLTKDKEKFEQTLEEKSEQLQKEQKEKMVLLTSLEKTSDQLKLSQEENSTQKLALEQQVAELKELFENLTLQNTKLQGDLVEREAELQQSQEEQQLENEKFQQQISNFQKQLVEKSEELESLDMALMAILAVMENNFNLSQDIENKDVKNLFKSQENDEENHETQNLQKLRQNLNLLWFAQQKLQKELQDLSLKNEETSSSFQTFKKSNHDLHLKLNQQEKVLLELREQLDNEELSIEKRISHQVKRLEEDLLNLEKVNERLSHENVNIHVKLDDVQQEFKESKNLVNKLEEDKLQLQEEVRSKTLALEKLQQEEKKLQSTLKERCQYSEKVSEKSKSFEAQFKEKHTKLQNLEKFCHELKEKSQKSQQKLSHYQTQHQTQQVEVKKLQDKLKQSQLSNETLELDLAKKNKELLALTNKNSETSQQLKEVEQQLQLTSKKLDDTMTLKLNAETLSQQFLSEKQQLKRDLDFVTSQQQSHQEEHSRLTQEIENLKQDKQQLRDEIKETKLSLQMANDNVSQLIQQISSIRLEKEATLEENQLFRKQLEETGKHQSSSETKLKSIIEKSQDFERKLLTTENELKSLKVQLEKSETSSAKLLMENKKLRDTQEAATKRIEKMALKLGDSQARSAKLERDNEKLGKTLENNSVTVEALQKEKDLLQSEAKCLKERLSRAERGHEQLAAKVHNLERLNASLHEIKQKLEASELDGKTKLNKLEKMREANEEKLRKLAGSLNNAEHTNVKLNLEIGALNSQLQELQTEHSQEQQQREEDLKQQLEQAQDLTHKYEDLNEKLKLELHHVQDENSLLNDQLSKVSLSLDITKQKCEKMSHEMEQIRADMLIIRQEKSQIELQHETSIQKLSQFESQNTKLLYERKNMVKSLEQRILALEEELAAKTKEVDDLQNEIEVLKENSETHSSLIQQTHTNSLSELQQLQTKLLLADETMQKEQQLIAQLRLDNQILHTKYQESKQRALEAATTSEERIKENRLELEGKLEKMKNKMKTLYTEEITKMKTKQEREVALIKSELEVHKTQNAKYEEHTRKLSNQIVRLNDNILEHQKENTMLSTKLKHIMEQQHHEGERFKRPSSIHVSTVSSSTAPAAASNNIGTNLAMEDEEGEVFNNTYLTDLKNGRMSELMNRDVCVEELKYRNSLLPPHLRSTYAAQYDHEFPEDDLKDGPHSFDDSMSALLSTTAGGTRKKCSGVTHYKRPGPPTPSKNGGRLSFGGISEPGREILKESYDTNAAGSSTVSSSAKTPARFNFFASRFSMGSARDEKPIIKSEPELKPTIKQEPEMKPTVKQELETKPIVKQESDDLNLRKALHKNNIKGNGRLLTGVGYTSTPRKSKVHYDQRRLLEQLMTSSPSPSPLSIAHKNIHIESKITPPDVSLIETPVTIFDRRDLLKAAAPIQHKSNAKRMVAIAGGLRRNRRNSSMFGRRLSRRMQEICTPTSGETTSSAMSTPVVEKVKKQVVCTTVTTTSGGVGKSAVLQRRLRKRPKRERGARPSLYLRGNIFAKYRTPNKAALQDLNRYKSRKQRCDHFNKGRDIQSFKTDECPTESDKTISVKALKDKTYDLKNNNYATFNHNNILGETVVLSKLPVKPKHKEETFTFGEEVFESHDTEELDYMEDYESDEDYDEEEDEEEEISNDKKCYFAIKKESCKLDLITTQDLEAFDRYIAQSKVKPKREDIDEVSYRSNGSSQQFEKLLMETESNAPFEVKHIQFNVTKSSHSSKSTHSYQSSSLNHSHPLHSTSQDRDHANVSTATPHTSPSNLHPSGLLSRTIYGGTVIYNHRLPNINTTFVRKSSIYVKNRNKSIGGHHHHPHHVDASSCNDDDVVLITNQTITFVDIMRMWSQMDNSTRIIVSFAILASFTTILGLCVSFYQKR